MKQTTEVSETVRLCTTVLQRLKTTPVLERTITALLNENFDQIIDQKQPDATTYACTSEFVVDYFAFNLLRKFPFKGRDRKKAALDSFKSGEEKCKQTNIRLRKLWKDSPSTRDQIYWMREKIANLLGPFDWNEAACNFAWGPGATTRLKSVNGDVYFKFRGKPETTQNCFPLSVAAVSVIPLWFGEIHPLKREDMFTVVAGSRITTVPKDAKTDRTIAIEPCMNMYVQKGIGTMIRNRLRRAGIDLNDQTRNQELAKEAYVRGLATIDLSAASDSVSSELVELLLPDDWLLALKQCRSYRYVLASEVGYFEKFSTMGNGYTFELESLLFWAITSLSVAESFAADDVVAVYGDDIICHEFAAPRLISNLNTYGFEVNTKKSFLSGPFFESCGKHYFRGVDVTPVYVKEPVILPHRAAWFANSIARWGERANACGVSCASAYLAARERVTVPWSNPIPNGVGDGGLVVVNGESPVCDRRLSRKRCKCQDYQSGICFKIWAVERYHALPQDVPYLLRSLYKLEASRRLSSFERSIDPAKEISGVPEGPLSYRKTRGWIHQWEGITLH